MHYQVKFVVYGPAEADERGFGRREALTEIEHVVPAHVATEVCSAVMKLLGARMELAERAVLIPRVNEEDGA